ncbi:guanylate-binding protein 1-like isoform X2 [Cricetulus griseus]|uniref:Guanylate-binding protein 1-like isoform X2 n=1 Tax=Cricetulus griseus TaxID=10029 RepID=A0A9J7F5M5_CRIGR|nr:guanylate-binding protein 1-like isoform X2 [Cricetulus griseus]
MAIEVHMPGPMCLIENVKGQLIANQEALGILEDITQPVVVVSIVGLYRTGKSYLMNKLAGKQTGFSLGSTVQSHTKGIWMWCFPHPQKPGHTLVLLDTEGLGDVEKGDNQNDCWIFALAILLSSTFVYNSMGPINQPAIDQLHYVTELTDRIRSRSSPDQDEVEDSDEFVRFFPDFVWALRDFSLELKLNGEPISADEYLENSLKLKQGTGQRDKVKDLNLPQLCIHKFFPKKKCFVFERPTHGRKVGQMESLQDQDLDSDFVEQVAEFCSYLFSSSKVKMLSGCIKVNGPRLKSLVVTYVNTICSGSLPCIENAVLALSQTENAAAVQKAIAHYDQQMNQKLQLPTETLQELLNVHRACEKEAIKIFMENSFKDVNQVFLTQFVTELETKQEEFLKKNEQASSDRCLALLQDIFNPFEEDVKQGIYYKPGGYHLYIQKTRELKKKYYDEPRKGVQAEEVLQKFLQSKDDVTDTILQIDQELTVKEKESEVERMKAEAAQATAKIQEEMQQKIEQLLQEKEKSHEEHSKQLTEMMGKAQDQNKNMQQLVEQLVQQKGKSDEDHRKKLTEKVDEAQAKLRELQKEKEHLQNQMKCLEEKIKHLPEEKKKENHEYDQLREQYEDLKKKIIQIDEELRNKQGKSCVIS